MEKQLLPSVRNVGASQIASVEIPHGPTHNRLAFELGGTFTKSHLDKIELRANSKPFFTVTGDHLASMNAYKGQAAKATVLELPLIETRARTLGGMYHGQMVTDPWSGIVNIGAEITIGAGPISPTMNVYSLVTESPGDPQGMSHWEREARDMFSGLLYRPEAITGAGDWPLNFPKGPESPRILKRMYFFDPSGILTTIKVKRNGRWIFEPASVDVIESDQMAFGLVPQSGLVVVDFILSGDSKRGINMANSRTWQVNVETTGAGTLHIYEEVISKLNYF